MREGTGGADALARELVTDIWGSVAVSEFASVTMVRGLQWGVWFTRRRQTSCLLCRISTSPP